MTEWDNKNLLELIEAHIDYTLYIWWLEAKIKWLEFRIAINNILLSILAWIEKQL